MKSLFAYFFYRKVCNEILNGKQLYNIRGLVLISIGVIVSGIGISFVNRILWLKYLIITLALILIAVSHKTIINIIKGIVSN